MPNNAMFPSKRFCKSHRVTSDSHVSMKTRRCLGCANCIVQPSLHYERTEKGRATAIPEQLFGTLKCIIDPRHFNLCSACPNYAESPLVVGDDTLRKYADGSPVRAGDHVELNQNGFRYEGWVIDAVTVGKDCHMEDDFAFAPDWSKAKKV